VHFRSIPRGPCEQLTLLRAASVAIGDSILVLARQICLFSPLCRLHVLVALEDARSPASVSRATSLPVDRQVEWSICPLRDRPPGQRHRVRAREVVGICHLGFVGGEQSLPSGHPES